jgi:hypothetical protein
MDWINLAQDKDKWSALVNTGSITFWEFPEWLHNWRFLKKGSAPLSC